MSSAINHRRRSHKCYEKRVSAMNTFQRKALVKEHQPSFRERILISAQFSRENIDVDEASSEPF